MKVLRLFSRASATSSPNNQFNKGFSTVTSISVPYIENGVEINRSFLFYFRYISKCIRFHKDNLDIQAIHCHNTYLLPAALVTKWLGKTKVPIIYTLHTSYQLLKLRSKIILWLSFVQIDSVVACGVTVRDTLPKLLSKSSKTITIRNAVNLEFLEKQLRNSAHSTSNGQYGNPSIYTACRLVVGKNVLHQINLFEKIQKALPDAHLHIYGDGPLRKNIERKIRHNNAITLHGQVTREQLYSEIPQKHIYLSLSAGEGMPIAPLEALSAGLYAILSDIAPHRELKLMFPKQVWLLDIDEGNLDDVINKLTKIEQPEIGITELAKAQVSLDSMEKAYKQVYEQGASKIKAVFNEKSISYNEHYSSLRADMYSREKILRLENTVRVIMKKMHVGGNILDIGCGTGILLQHLIDRIETFNYVGVDTSTGMIKEAKKLKTRQSENQKSKLFDNIQCIGDADYDTIVSLGVVGYQENQYSFLEDIVRHLHPSVNSRLIITIGNHGSPIRKLRDFIKRSILRNKSAYQGTPNKYINRLKTKNHLETVEVIYLLPIFSFLPEQLDSNTKSFLRIFYLTKFLVMKPNQE